MRVAMPVVRRERQLALGGEHGADAEYGKQPPEGRSRESRGRLHDELRAFSRNPLSLTDRRSRNVPIT